MCIRDRKYTIVSRPVDKRENYIKRCVAIAGDSLEVRDGQVWVCLLYTSRPVR